MRHKKITTPANLETNQSFKQKKGDGGASERRGDTHLGLDVAGSQFLATVTDTGRSYVHGCL